MDSGPAIEAVEEDRGSVPKDAPRRESRTAEAAKGIGEGRMRRSGTRHPTGEGSV